MTVIVMVFPVAVINRSRSRRYTGSACHIRIRCYGRSRSHTHSRSHRGLVARALVFERTMASSDDYSQHLFFDDGR